MVEPLIADKAGWLEVRLATRPNGSTAWVQQGDVTLTATPDWVSVDLSSRQWPSSGSARKS